MVEAAMMAAMSVNAQNGYEELAWRGRYFCLWTGRTGYFVARM